MSLGDTSTLLDPAVVEEIKTRHIDNSIPTVALPSMQVHHTIGESSSDLRYTMLPLRTLLLLSVFAPIMVIAQFTYIGGELRYAALRLNKTPVRQGGFAAVVVHRPWRHIGLGFAVSAPIVQAGEGKSSFWKGSGTGHFALYKATIYEHELRQSVGYTGIVRFFIETELNIFIDLQVTYANVSESLRLQRNSAPAEYSGGGLGILYAAIPELDISYYRNHRVTVPGISVGLMPHLTHNVYLSITGGLNLYRFTGPDYSYDIPYRPVFMEDRHGYMRFESPVQGQKAEWNINVGAGMFF